MTGPFEKHHPGFARLIPHGAAMERIACGFGFTEGPLWNGDHLLFTDITNSRIVRWQQLDEGPEVRTLRVPTNLANGLTFDRQRRLVICEGGARRVTRLEADGTITVLADRYEGQRLNAPNDVVGARDGSVYFSDPWWATLFKNPYGPRVQSTEREMAYAAVFRVAPDGALSVASLDFDHPNGLAFSPDERILYVDDTRLFHIKAFDVRADGTLANGRVFADLHAPQIGGPDGMKVDVEGNVYCTGPGGIWVIAPDGVLLGRILPPEQPANLAWGESDWRTLFITARTSVYRLRLSIPGVPV